jgi:hypothetical protein
MWSARPPTLLRDHGRKQLSEPAVRDFGGFLIGVDDGGHGRTVKVRPQGPGTPEVPAPTAGQAIKASR